MCIAILKTKKGKISDEALRNSFNSNSDGAGIAYTINNKLIIEKGIFKVDDFIKAVRKAEEICDNNMLIHCRIGTSGLKDKSNTHPFSINKNVCLIHNGVLDVDVPKGSDKNDTRLFIERYMTEFNTHTLMHNKQFHKLIENEIGPSNKFVLMDNTGYYKILNENKGHWKNDVWYSNTSYEDRTYGWANWNSWYDRYDKWYNSTDEGAYEEDTQLYIDIENAIYALTHEELLILHDDLPLYCPETKQIMSYQQAEDFCVDTQTSYDFMHIEDVSDYLAGVLEDLIEDAYEYECRYQEMLEEEENNKETDYARNED